MRHAVFVVPFAFETSLRFLERAVRLPGLRLSVVSGDPSFKIPEATRHPLVGFEQVADPLNPGQLAAAIQKLEAQHGKVERLVGVLEQLQVPLAQVREHLGIPGLGVQAARNFRDKARMKDVLRANGLPCAAHRLCHSTDEALHFMRELGGPAVAKPPDGAGAKGTYRVESAEQLAELLRHSPPSAHAPLLLEEFVQGEEFSFDAVFMAGHMVWHNINCYRPSPLQVVQNEWIQWCVLLPHDISGGEFDPIRRDGERAMRVLGLETGLAHMEWFQRPDGSIAISEVGARPPGAQFTSLMSYTHDTDMYAAWAKLVLLDSFDPPARKYASGAAYLRGMGRGRVKAIHGLADAQARMGDIVVDVRLPEIGKPGATSGYEGDGYAILRHPNTAVVERGLADLISRVRVELG
ncbi:MAG: hypothetical protein DHS20C15_23960 [Planctomycetota bacterium]|nr:MAG: hypothetical protein DHS20C15_23960 [Planctomycetota bacterium]